MYLLVLVKIKVNGQSQNFVGYCDKDQEKLIAKSASFLLQFLKACQHTD